MSTEGSMDPENVLQIHDRILFGYTKEENPAFCNYMDGP